MDMLNRTLWAAYKLGLNDARQGKSFSNPGAFLSNEEWLSYQYGYLAGTKEECIQEMLVARYAQHDGA